MFFLLLLYGIILLMRYTVPQFIEYEAKVVGPFTFGQFIFIALSAAVCFVLYFMLPLTLFVLASFVIMVSVVILSIVRVGGRPVTTIIGNFFKFNIGTKVYIWKKKEMPVMYAKSDLKKELEMKKELDEGLPLKIAENSQLKRMKTKIETR